MTIHRSSSWTKIFVVVLCLVAWLEMSNHCALAALRSEPQKVKTCCHAGKKQPMKETMRVCCQKLQTTEQVNLSVPSLPLAMLGDDLLTFLNFIVAAWGEEPIVRIQHGDPPSASLASRLDSERCHPAFAPPLLS